MKKVKLIKASSSYGYDRYDNEIRTKEVDYVTAWEEITDEEYEVLKSWVRNQKITYPDPSYLILLEEVSKQDTVITIKQVLEQAKAAEEKRSVAAEKRKKAEEKRNKALAAKQIEKDRKTLEKLKAKLGEK